MTRFLTFAQNRIKPERWYSPCVPVFLYGFNTLEKILGDGFFDAVAKGNLAQNDTVFYIVREIATPVTSVTGSQ